MFTHYTCKIRLEISSDNYIKLLLKMINSLNYLSFPVTKNLICSDSAICYKLEKFFLWWPKIWCGNMRLAIRAMREYLFGQFSQSHRAKRMVQLLIIFKIYICTHRHWCAKTLTVIRYTYVKFELWLFVYSVPKVQ